MKRTRRYAGTLGVLFFSLALAACGGGGGGGDGGPKTGEILLKATALKNQQAVAAAPKALDRMWALLSTKEAVAQATTCDDNKKFTLQGGTETVCLTKAYVVFDEIELEQETEPSTGGDEIELGPFVVDLLGVANDGIPGSITIAVPDASFNKIKFKIDDLDDRDGGGLSDDSPTDDHPKNVTSQVATSAGLVKKSLVIEGTRSSDGASFVFSSDIEGKIEVPFSAGVLDQSTLITFFDLTAAFSALSASAIAPSMDGSMEDKKCSDLALDDSEKLACSIVKNIDLFDDSDDDGVGDDSEFRGNDDVGFDDSGGRD